MTGEERLLIAFNLHEMSYEIARDGIRGRYPNATPEAVEMKLHERTQAVGLGWVNCWGFAPEDSPG